MSFDEEDESESLVFVESPKVQPDPQCVAIVPALPCRALRPPSLPAVPIATFAVLRVTDVRLDSDELAARECSMTRTLCVAALRLALRQTQVGVLRRGKYVKGKKIGKGTLVQEVRLHSALQSCG